jgi:hypothetical protein
MAAPVAVAGVTYHKDIRPIVEARCLGCHVEGASGPFPLDTFERVQGLGALVVAAVTSRRMPPWLADDTDCTPIRDDQRLSDEQLTLFTAWEADGFPVGNEADFVALPGPTQREIGEPDVIIKATRPFQLTGGIEDYFCLRTDASFAEDTFVTAMDMVPEHDEYVHHAIINVGATCSALGTLASTGTHPHRSGARQPARAHQSKPQRARHARSRARPAAGSRRGGDLDWLFRAPRARSGERCRAGE